MARQGLLAGTARSNQNNPIHPRPPLPGPPWPAGSPPHLIFLPNPSLTSSSPLTPPSPDLPWQAGSPPHARCQPARRGSAARALPGSRVSPPGAARCLRTAGEGGREDGWVGGKWVGGRVSGMRVHAQEGACACVCSFACVKGAYSSRVDGCTSGPYPFSTAHTLLPSRARPHKLLNYGFNPLLKQQCQIGLLTKAHSRLDLSGVSRCTGGV